MNDVKLKFDLNPDQRQCIALAYDLAVKSLGPVKVGRNKEQIHLHRQKKIELKKLKKKFDKKSLYVKLKPAEVRYTMNLVTIQLQSIEGGFITKKFQTEDQKKNAQTFYELYKGIYNYMKGPGEK